MGRLRERTQYLKIKKYFYRLLRSSAGILPEKFNSAKLKKKKNRDEKGFRTFANFTGVFDNISFTFSLKMF
jgi:hypothetical protein